MPGLDVRPWAEERELRLVEDLVGLFADEEVALRLLELLAEY